MYGLCKCKCGVKYFCVAKQCVEWLKHNTVCWSIRKQNIPLSKNYLRGKDEKTDKKAGQGNRDGKRERDWQRVR